LAEVPPEVKWFDNIDNAQTRRAYKNALKDFMNFGVSNNQKNSEKNRVHIIAWRDELVSMTIRHRLATLSSLFEYLYEHNTVTHNPVKGVKWPAVESSEGKAPALGDNQARKLLDIPDGVSLKGKRNRAILATLFYHVLRRDEICRLKV